MAGTSSKVEPGTERAARRPAFGKLLVTHPIQQFRKDPRFYLRYDAAYFVLCAAVSAVLLLTHVKPVFASVVWSPWVFVVAYPPLVYFLICSHLWIHNATHGSFPRWANRLVGEVLGVVVFVRFASWQIVHFRHHEESDDRKRDPHPNYPSYFRSFFTSIVTVEKQLQNAYCDVWGDTEENRRYEAFRARVSYATNVVLALAWYLVLGPVAFFALYFPANVLAAAFVGHFNWATHNGEAGGDFRPVNLDHGYYWLGNRIFTGIYFHANHHKRPHLFNPRHWDERRYGPQEPLVDAPEAQAPQAAA